MSFAVLRKPIGGRQSSDSFSQVTTPISFSVADIHPTFSPAFDTAYHPKDFTLNFNPVPISGKPMETYVSGSGQNLRRTAWPPSRNPDSDRDIKHSWDVELSSLGGQALGDRVEVYQEAENAEVEDGDPFNYITGKRRCILTLSLVHQPKPLTFCWHSLPSQPVYLSMAGQHGVNYC